MARKNKGDIKINKNHGGKEFSNSFHFVGQVKPVRKKERDSDNWFDVEFFDTNETRTGKQRRVLQFNLETAFRNELKIELAGMKMPQAFAWSSVARKTQRLNWENRFDKSLYPDDTYHLIETDWDKSERFSHLIAEGIWIEVRGHYEFNSFNNDDGDEINVVKRIADQIYQLKNAEVVITGLKEKDTFRVYDAPEDGLLLGQGKAGKDGVATVHTGWLNPEGGELFVTKVVNDKETKRGKFAYTDGTVTPTASITINNNVDSQVRLPKQGGGYDYVKYVRDFNNEDFNEVNSFEMQLAINSTYQDEETKDTKVNGIFLDYGKEKSTPHKVDLTVYNKEVSEGKTSLADAFSKIEHLDFMVVEGVDNNRAEFAMVAVEETDESDNPFEDVDDKVVDYERTTTGTKKGLEVTNYVTGTFHRGLLEENEISINEDEGNPFETVDNNDPFADTSTPIEISDEDLPF
jgi:hypothetical protein